MADAQLQLSAADVTMASQGLVVPPESDASQLDMLDPSFFEAQDWPSEILDSMTWSAQFLGAVQDMSS